MDRAPITCPPASVLTAVSPAAVADPLATAHERGVRATICRRGLSFLSCECSRLGCVASPSKVLHLHLLSHGV